MSFDMEDFFGGFKSFNKLYEGFKTHFFPREWNVHYFDYSFFYHFQEQLFKSDVNDPH